MTSGDLKYSPQSQRSY